MCFALRLRVVAALLSALCFPVCAQDPPAFRVLLPDVLAEGKPHRVLYVLPVEAGDNQRYGDPLQVLREQNVHNDHALILILPRFETDPWYGDHASNPRRRYEHQLVHEVVPAVDRLYPTLAQPEGRLLLGFSKSGWGAFTLLLRNPSVFGYAASWDAPLMLTEKHFGIWRTDETFGTAANMARYLPTRLFAEAGAEFRERPRLVLAGKHSFGTATDKRFPYDGPCHTEGAHALLVQLGIPHRFDAAVSAPHSWNAAWITPVLRMLLETAAARQ